MTRLIPTPGTQIIPDHYIHFPACSAAVILHAAGYAVCSTRGVSLRRKKSAVMRPAELHSQPEPGVRVDQSEASIQCSDQLEANKASPMAHLGTGFFANKLWRNCYGTRLDSGIQDAGVTWSGAGLVRDSQECFLLANQKVRTVTNWPIRGLVN